MINRAMFQEIQTYKRKGYSKGAIGRELELDPRTVAKYFGMDEAAFREYRVEHLVRDKAFDRFREEILEVYKANDFRKLQVSSVYDYLEERCGALPGNEQTLRNYIGYLVRSEELHLGGGMRLYSKVAELPYGRQMQLDFGRHRCRGGLVLYIFTSLLSASRAKYVVFQGQPFQTIHVIRHLLDAFDYLGGRPEELVIDQDRLMVVSENAGDIVYTKGFKEFTDEQELRLYVCRGADPESKGKVENLVKFVKGSFLGTRDFDRLEEANAGLRDWLERRANGKISQATRQVPTVVLEEERSHLRPPRNSIFRKDLLAGREERTANEKALISVQACCYQLPVDYRRKTVEIYVTGERLFVFDPVSGREIITYPLSLLPGQIVSDRACRRENGKTIEELKAAVGEIYELEAWKTFVAWNFQRFPRYVRDQCAEAKRSFAEKKIELEILERAIRYCLENDTPSFLNLKDACEHYHRESRRSEPAPIPDGGPSRSYPSVQVSQRQVTDYERAARERAVS
jgi:hypothetical protein